jgi:DNA-binding PadR family transcriptional regulator
VKFEYLVEAGRILKPHWRNAVILCLEARGPLSYREIERALVAYADELMSSGHLTRVLSALTDQALITTDGGAVTDTVYTLTKAGRIRAQLLRTIGNAVCDAENGD